ncbi:mycofactocin biosynthesis chaperone MftB [Deferrisoma camini]|uniref:mycofactocin biosynthesis chaperone MftB n=1 Tax=Deferrisoma camini TaxID=1035120 RepID=UPI00046D4A33|nr:mycofactocin biosynthesis chaperone MftB [Deferrisoma camini]
METRCHVLHPSCRVRQEAFGLLFYDMRGPRLLFARTGDLLDAGVIARGLPVEQALRARDPSSRAAAERLILHLVEKGFLREQPVC